MQVKKFTAQSLSEATKQMKNELGYEAVILSTRVINDRKNPSLKLYEITAGIDELPDENKPNNISNAHKTFLEELAKISDSVYRKNPVKIKETYGKANEEKIKVSEETIEKKLKSVFRQLADKEVQKSVLVSVMEQMKKYKNFLHPDNIENYVKTCLSSLILTKNFDVTPKKNKIVALVGPTGVGKTTTIAKLALIAKIIHKLDVGLISIDTFRLGAIDQLQSFADVSHIDLLVAYKPEEMPALLKKFSKKDIVFIDTVGRSQNKAEQLKLNQDFLSTIKIDETLLVLNSSSSYRTLSDVAAKFKAFNYSGFIFSKVDEAPVHGNIVNLITKTGVPVSFITNGQVIPDDILAADSENIANLILNSSL
ncbi:MULTISPECIES: flagellar biosynthesis protein FlhF [Ignavibacterium]|jgi:flagellar biosynthesis protein FlhF|uniref:flagellar biosynthesis protein FlhF n=1 Tax=Ignavibacterium TaxID=795750 RepID=UPI0025BB352B|nr:MULTISPECIES: flagellar biosynthesis protein FlhF [Ignavibacterium]MBI5662692.1 flagellar biosynthesis protein FlhF [Ignavibacterium album]